MHICECFVVVRVGGCVCAAHALREQRSRGFRVEVRRAKSDQLIFCMWEVSALCALCVCVCVCFQQKMVAYRAYGYEPRQPSCVIQSSKFHTTPKNCSLGAIVILAQGT